MRFPRSVLIYLGSLTLLAVSLAAYCLWRYPPGGGVVSWLLFAALVLLVALSDRNGLHLAEGTNIHVDAIPLLTAVMLFNPGMAVLIGAIGRLLGRIDRRILIVERVFNVGQTLIYMSVSALLLHFFTVTPWRPAGLSSWLGVASSMIAMYVLNTLLVAGIVSLNSQANAFRFWIKSVLSDVLEQAVMAGFALIATLAVVPYPWALPLMALPSIVVFVTLDRTLKMEAQQKQLAQTNAELASHLSQQAEQLRDAYAVLEDALDAKNQMLQNVSHELRTPMVTVSGYTEALQDGLYGELSQSQLGALGIVSQSTQTMIRMVNDLLSLQALDRGQLQMSEVSLLEILRNCADNFAQRAQAAGIELDIDDSLGLPILHADPMRLEQVISNLIDNAIKFSPDGGVVRVYAQILDGCDAQIVVSDQGIGIPEDQLPNIYRRFYQVDGSRKRRFGGQGLGLAIAKRIIELHGGSIRAESQVGQGTSFYITLPMAGVPAAQLPVDL